MKHFEEKVKHQLQNNYQAKQQLNVLINLIAEKKNEKNKNNIRNIIRIYIKKKKKTDTKINNS